MNKEEKKELNFQGIRRLFELLSKIDKPRKIELILRDLLSPKEIRNIARRLLVAEMLMEEMTYTHIQDKTDMSPITINKISQKLKHDYGSFDLLFETIRKPGDRIFNKLPKKLDDYSTLSSTERYFKKRLEKGK